MKKFTIDLQITSIMKCIEENLVKEFYSCLKFPGLYTYDDLKFYDAGIYNRYLKVYNDAIPTRGTVLDVGCGSGFIINLLALKHPEVDFYAIDFSDSIDYAREFGIKHGIRNVTYLKENFLNFDFSKQFDVILSNGVIHHIPDFQKALDKIKIVSKPGGKVILGIYNKYGKLAKKFFKVKYENCVLEKDQEQVPFEISFSDREFRNSFPYPVVSIMPSVLNKLVDVINLFNYKNGGLTIYTFQA